ncbi:MAG: CvpA family protein [Bacteroidales bacterium]|nr:CvpA family protein [Bacteroidales bacterium]MCF6343037.1 CvpA family protein [Bacteroidales bacterium]
MSISTIDIILLIPMLLFAWSGYKKGLIISLASLAALVLGLYFAFFFSDYAANLLTEHFTISKKYLAAISFVVTFVVVILAVTVLGNALHKIIDVLMLGFLNKAAGAVFGILKGALYMSILIFVINYFGVEQSLINKDSRDKSLFYEPVASVAPFIYSWLNLEDLNIDLPDKEEILEEVY